MGGAGACTGGNVICCFCGARRRNWDCCFPFLCCRWVSARPFFLSEFFFQFLFGYFLSCVCVVLFCFVFTSLPQLWASPVGPVVGSKTSVCLISTRDRPLLRLRATSSVTSVGVCVRLTAEGIGGTLFACFFRDFIWFLFYQLRRHFPVLARFVCCSCRRLCFVFF